MDWHLIIDLGGFFVVLLTLAAGYGRMEQKVKEMGKVVDSNTAKLEKHDEQLTDGRVNFGKIDTKLDHLVETVDSMATKLDGHLMRQDGR